MTVFGSTGIFFFTYFVMKLINYHLRRKETLKVVRLHDKRYFIKELYSQVRSYLFSFKTWNSSLISFICLGSLLSIMYIQFKYTAIEEVEREILVIPFFIGIVFSLFFQKQVSKNVFYLLDNQFYLILISFSLLFFIPQVLLSLSPLISFLFKAVFFFIMLNVSYQLIWYLNKSIYLPHKKIIVMMTLFLFVSLYMSYIYSGLEVGMMKYIIVWGHALLISSILLSYQLNSIPRKVNIITRYNYISVMALALLVVSSTIGGS